MNLPQAVQKQSAALRVWRDAPSFQGHRTAAIGAFACDTSDDGARLLNDVARALAAEGFGAVIGPMDGDTWSRHRLVTESNGRPPFLMEPHSPPHHAAAFDEAGWDAIARYASAEGPLSNATATKVIDDDIVLRAFNPVRGEEELRRLHALSLDAFRDNFLYRPQSAGRFLAQYRPLLPALDPDLIVLAEDKTGALQGFLFAAPDMADFSADRAVVLKTYASLKPGLGSRMAQRFYKRAAARGYRRVIHALMHDDNLSARHSDRLGAEVFRRYALWGRLL